MTNIRSMLKGLLNDTDGSYAKKILVDHPEEVSRFDEKIQQHIGETQQLVAQENQNIQQEQQQGFSRSI